MIPRQMLRLLVTLICGRFVIASNIRERQCCGYSINNNQSSICHHSNECIVLSLNGSSSQNNGISSSAMSYKTHSLEECQIITDSKLKENAVVDEGSKLECLSQTFDGEDIRQAQVIYGIILGLKDDKAQEVEYESNLNLQIDDSIPLPFSIHPYIFEYPGATPGFLPALEVRVAYGVDSSWHSSPSSWSQLRFRILNRNHCNTNKEGLEANPTSLDSCSPRCVSVTRQQNQPKEKIKGTEDVRKDRPGNVGS